MRIAIFSDIHGNLEAFREVLDDINGSFVDAVFCLGDNIGYGPEPEEVLGLLQEKAIPSVQGNHEIACIDSTILDRFNPTACESLKKTIQMLSPGSLGFIAGLNKSMVHHDCRFVHGFPPNSATTYLFQISWAKMHRFMSTMKERICFIGHTHELRIIEYDGEKCISKVLKRGIYQLKRHSRYIINIGSVGQPRDGNNRAKYVIWDTDMDLIDVRYVRYDIEKVVKKILAAGLPEVHATRLW